MSVFGWIIAGLLAAAYLAAGSTKLVQPKEKLLKQDSFGWVEGFTAAQLKGIGAVEVAGALGVVLPWLLDIANVLTPIAAVGLGAVQLGAIRVHARRGEYKVLPANVVLLILAIVLAAVRFSQL